MRAVPVTVEAQVEAPVERTFDFVVAEDVLPKVLLGYGPLPAVVGTSGNTGPWDQVGSRRTVHLASGDTAREEVTEFERPRYFAYRVSDFTLSARHFVAEARGQWWFDAGDPGTHIRWTYTFEPRSAFALPLLLPFAHLLWRGYMRVAMDAIQRQLG